MSRTILQEAHATMRLAWPLVLGFAGNQLLGLVDTAMVGRLGAAELAGSALGNAIFFTLSVVGMGWVAGMDPLASQAVGAGEGARAHAAFGAALRLALLLAVPVTLLVLLGSSALSVFGVDAATGAAARSYLLGRAPGVLPFLLMAAYRGVLQARSFTKPILVSTIVANVLNVVANSLLIFGDGALDWLGLPGVGLPALGVLGAAIGSSIATAGQLAVLVLAERALPRLAGEGDTALGMRDVMRVGLPIGLTLLAEVGAFSIAGILAARLGPASGAGHQVAINLASTTFVVTMGVANATSVRVGQAVGRGDAAGARRAGMAGFATALAFMTVSAAVFLAFAHELAGLLSDRADVLAAAVPLVHIAAFFQVFDGAQVVGAGALRGIGETRFTQYANVVGYYVVGLPVAMWLAFWAGLDARGLWWGLSAGLMIVSVALYWRFARVSRGDIARIA